MPAVEARFRAMGTDAHLLVTGAGAEDLVDQGRGRIASLEQRWSRFVGDSELSRLNRMAGGPVLVTRETYDLIDAAVAAWHGTDGRFDPTVLSAMVANGYDRSFDLLDDRPDGGAPGADHPAPGCAHIELDATLAAVTLPPGVGLDLGGIAKGRAVDVVADELLRAGAAGVCVNLGGDLRVAGAAPIEAGWVVGIDDPFAPGATAQTIALSLGAVVTSSRTRRRWMSAGRRRHHLVDPATGSPSDSGVAAVTVVAGEAVVAEVLAKDVLLAGHERGEEILAEAGAAGLLTKDDGSVARLGEWRAYEP